MRAQVLAALEESLAATPDPGDVLRSIQSGVARRHRRNRYLRTGFAIVTIAVLLILSIASAMPAPRHREPTGVPVGEWKNSIRPTWLPDGFVAQEFMVTLSSESIRYHSPVSELSITVTSTDPLGGSAPGWEQFEINGRPARQISANSLGWVVFQLASGRWARIDLNQFRPTETNVAPTAGADALHIARSVEETGDLRLRTKFKPTYLPTGQGVIGVESNIFTPAGFGGIVCAAGAGEHDPRWFISMTNIAINKDLDVTARIDDIQGRPAYRSVSGQTVYVADFHGGTLTVGAVNQAAVRIEPTVPAVLPLHELIKVAERVRWIG